MNDMHNSDTKSMKDLFILYYIGYVIYFFLSKSEFRKRLETKYNDNAIFSCWAEQSIDCTLRSLAVTRNPASLVFILFMGLLTTKFND
jgi:hypothetical protein